MLLCTSMPFGAAAADRVPTVGYVDPFGGWYLSSIFPLFRSAFDKAGVAVDLIDIKQADTEAKLWDQIRRFEVLLISDWDLADKHRATFEKYLAAGGGVLVVTPYSGLQDRQDLMAKLPETLQWLGIKPFAQGVHDPKTEFGSYSWTRQIIQHPATTGVDCIAFPKDGDYGRVATQRLELSPDWTVLIRSEKTARIYSVHASHTSWFPVWEESGENETQSPLFAVREAGIGRIALLPMDPGYIIWNVGNPAFPQVFMSIGDEKTNHSSGFRLFLNTLKWLAKPAQTLGQVGGYKSNPAIVKPFQFQKKVAPVKLPKESRGAPQFRGLIGVRSNLSDGQTSVSEYATEARKLGLSFLIFADPWESLTEEKFVQLQSQCKEVSNETFRAIPGFQYSDTSGIRWIYFDPAFLPLPEYLQEGTKLVKYDGRFAFNEWMKSTHLTRMPLKVSHIQPDPRSLWWYHFLPVWESSNGKVDCDNTKVFFQNTGNGLSLTPAVYAEIGNLSELCSAAGQGLMVVPGANLDKAVSKFMTTAPWPVYEDNFSYITQGPQIDQFEIANWNASGKNLVKTAGAQDFGVRLSVSSKEGLEEVTLLSNNNKVHHRFLIHGAKHFTTAFNSIMDRQYTFVLRVKDLKGRLAYSSPHLAYSNTAGIYYCGDNLNTLQNANTSFYHSPRHEFPGAPPNWPPYFYGWRGWDGLQNMVRQAYLLSPYLCISAVDGPEIPSGDKYERPMELVLASYFCNVFRSRSTRSVRYSFPENTNESSAAVPVGETRYADQEVFSIIPSSRAGLEYFWHRPLWSADAFNNFRGSLALFEGSMNFKADVQLAEVVQPIPAVVASTWNTDISELTKYEPGIGLSVIQPILWKGDKLAPGGIMAAGPILGAPFLANLGDKPLQVEVSPQATAGRLGAFSVGLAESKQRVTAGTRMKFFLLNGFLEDGPAYGKNAADLAKAFNLAGGTSGYPLTVKTGRLVDTKFLLTIEAKAHEAQWKAGPRRMVIDLPVKLQGIEDNGCLAFYEKKLGHFVFVPTFDGQGLFQVAIDDGVDVWCGNVFISNHPKLRLTLIGAADRNPKLEVHNPTDNSITATITSPAHTPKFGGWSGNITVPAGSSKTIRIAPKK